MAHILVVDDSSLSRRMSRRILEEGGHEVTDVADGFSALERYAISKPDLVLLDVTMSEMDGFEVLRQLKQLDPHVRVVMATADVQTSTRSMAKDGGAVGFVTKPLNSDTLLNAVVAALTVSAGTT